ncbi:MAG: DNA primase [Methylomonas sp.]|nr:MAG: DNA primase [Methylobacter sp.]PPD36125.1 MAG: DNA primase [Methylomonas sp.]
MSGRIPREFINELLVRVDIVDLIDSYVPLKKTGSNFTARCPFHSEKTPSFSVSPKKQFFHCFGCGASGNAIGFLMDFNHLNFVEALESLAGFAGLEIPREADSGSGSIKTDTGHLVIALQKAAAIYSLQLRSTEEGKKAVVYLKNRRISSQIAQDYQLGYAPQQSKSLLANLNQDDLLAAGILGRNDNGETYPRFRNRVMFPIRDKRGRTIGFGGRVLDDSLPKYLNSPETPLFHKGREVYGLYELLEENPKPERIIVTEGYMDVIALAQFGIRYAVATLGTAATPAHFELLFRFTAELVLCFDGDNAGRQAVWRAIDAAMPSLRDGRQLRVLLLPQGQDPDSLVRSHGSSHFNTLITQAQPLSDYFFQQQQEGLNLTELEARAQLLNNCKPYLEKLPEGVYKTMMLTRLKELAKSDALENLAKPGKLSMPALKSFGKNRQSHSPLRMVLALLIQNPELLTLVEDKATAWEDLNFRGVDVFTNVIDTIKAIKPANAAALLEHFRDSEHEKIIKNLAAMELLMPEDGISQEFSDSLDKLIRQAKQSTLNSLLAKGKHLTEKEKKLLPKILQEIKQ